MLLVTVDTLRADAVGCYGAGDDARTPRMDRLAAEGIRFDQADASCPLTLPSHTTMLTGLSPAGHGFRDNDPPHPLPPPEHRSFRTLAEDLSGAGYRTAAFVSASVLAARTGLDAGFALYDGPEAAEAGSLKFAERRAAETVEAATAWLRAGDDPFFLWVHIFDPHHPYEAPPAFARGGGPDSPEAYADEVAYADRCVGMLLDAIEDRGVADQTLVIVTSDHGEGLGEHEEATHGYLLYETTLRVPLILRWPGRVTPGTVAAVPVALADIHPTALGAAGLPAPDGPPSLLAPDPDRVLVAETLYGWRHMGWAQLLAARSGSQKVIEGAGSERYDLTSDPREVAPLEAGRPGDPRSAFADELAAYAAVRPAFTSAPGESLPVPESFPYAAGVGRARLALLPPAVNLKLRPPSPSLASRIDEVAGRVGKSDPRSVERDLRSLEADDPGNPTLAFWRGRNAQAEADAAARRGDGISARESAARAAKAFREAFERGLEDAKVVNLLLKNLLLAERLEEAAAVVNREAREIVPDAGTYLMIGAVLQASGNLPEARRMADLAAVKARSDRERRLVSRFRHNLPPVKEE